MMPLAGNRPADLTNGYPAAAGIASVS